MAEPWKSKDAKELDNMTLQEWYNQTVWTKYVIYCSAVLPINMPHFTCPTVAVDDDVVAASTDNGCLLGGGGQCWLRHMTPYFHLGLHSVII